MKLSSLCPLQPWVNEPARLSVSLSPPQTRLLRPPAFLPSLFISSLPLRTDYLLAPTTWSSKLLSILSQFLFFLPILSPCSFSNRFSLLDQSSLPGHVVSQLPIPMLFWAAPASSVGRLASIAPQLSSCYYLYCLSQGISSCENGFVVPFLCLDFSFSPTVSTDFRPWTPPNRLSATSLSSRTIMTSTRSQLRMEGMHPVIAHSMRCPIFDVPIRLHKVGTQGIGLSRSRQGTDPRPHCCVPRTVTKCFSTLL